MVFQRTSAPALLGLLSLVGAKAAERKEGRSDVESNTREYVCKHVFFSVP